MKRTVCLLLIFAVLLSFVACTDEGPLGKSDDQLLSNDGTLGKSDDQLPSDDSSVTERPDDLIQDDSGKDFTICGAWTDSETGRTYVFNEDGTGEFWHCPSQIYIKETFDYSYDGERLNFRLNDPDDEIEPIEYNVRVYDYRGFYEVRGTWSGGDSSLVLIRPDDVKFAWESLDLHTEWKDGDNSVRFNDDGTFEMQYDDQMITGTYQLRTTYTDSYGKSSPTTVSEVILDPNDDEWLVLRSIHFQVISGPGYYCLDLLYAEWDEFFEPTKIPFEGTFTEKTVPQPEQSVQNTESVNDEKESAEQPSIGTPVNGKWTAVGGEDWTIEIEIHKNGTFDWNVNGYYCEVESGKINKLVMTGKSANGSGEYELNGNEIVFAIESNNVDLSGELEEELESTTWTIGNYRGIEEIYSERFSFVRQEDLSEVVCEYGDAILGKWFAGTDWVNFEKDGTFELYKDGALHSGTYTVEVAYFENVNIDGKPVISQIDICMESDSDIEFGCNYLDIGVERLHIGILGLDGYLYGYIDTEFTRN